MPRLSFICLQYTLEALAESDAAVQDAVYDFSKFSWKPSPAQPVKKPHNEDQISF